MKSIISIVLIVAFTTSMVTGLVPVKLTDEQLEKVRHIAVACMEKEKTTKEAVEAFSKGDFKSADRNLKCYANCFLNSTGIFVNGVVQPTAITTKLGHMVGEEKLNEILGKCSGVKGSDNCETAFLLFQCYHREHEANP